MTIRQSIIRIFIAIVSAAAFTTQAHALSVAYSGSYDEATGTEAGGDYDNIGGVGDFSLLNGANVFHGSIFTGGDDDSSDAFHIVISANQTLVGASIDFGTNANASNAWFGSPGPVWGLEENTTTPTIFEISMGDGASGPQTFSAAPFTRGPGIYNMLIGNGAFGMNNGGGVGYTMTFTVESSISAVPLPAALPLYGVGLAVMSFIGWRKKRKTNDTV
ncbi:hypothetical protein A9Q83_07500 [Alphaproteobacteria bacterium 46_93_T64]|nr:hypothetical protein A9Q83_07500 [Alphaproteobacteria bacterium 46_93_T64]